MVDHHPTDKHKQMQTHEREASSKLGNVITQTF